MGGSGRAHLQVQLGRGDLFGARGARVLQQLQTGKTRAGKRRERREVPVLIPAVAGVVAAAC
jgi:hypothetical protein